VDAITNQKIDQYNQCSNLVSPFSDCFMSSGNALGIGNSISGGTSIVSAIDTSANQEIVQRSNCSNLAAFGDCINQNDNGIAVGLASGRSTSTVSDVESDIDQKITVLIDCNNRIETCDQESDNLVSIASVEGILSSSMASEIDTDIEQSTKAIIRCDSMTICEQGSNNLVSIGSLNGDTFLSTDVSSIDARFRQNVEQSVECSDVGEFGTCGNGSFNRLEIGGSPIGGNAGTVSE
jgi:hypothetical protein